MMKKLAIPALLLVIMFVTACGSTNSSNVTHEEEYLPKKYTKAEIEEDMNLPKEPDPKDNDKDIEGIVGDDLVRDDVQRKIAFKYYPDKEKIYAMYRVGANYTKDIRAYEGFIKAETQEERDEYQRQYLENTAESANLIACLFYNYDMEGYFLSKEMEDLYNNNKARRKHVLKRDALAPSVIEVPALGNEENICPAYDMQ